MFAARSLARLAAIRAPLAAPATGARAAVAAVRHASLTGKIPANPNFSIEELPTNDQQATGPERKEMDFLAHHPHGTQDPFGREHITGPLGTKTNPIVIPSHYDYRISACMGTEGTPHDMAWFVALKGVMHRCNHCAQCFVLQVVADPDAEHDHAAHH
ncbi:hypothetical protein CAOG_07104 [Capsaspora owczarzaki ATCC 30864]|uniref:Uncharacterized protein n=1 Tax=Capsaspora owczarzaki (strain ATCC 30864) TaxID=595528 RepID=A0A0D2WWG3_CAPO3|nr:hypothetical protein CAOG_07104 [Capsaspora owczarzaki ATCC 30864]KJE96843.1 hypothetical protein CAOG_007104 [Capsaspora owczarzaki ATCC 30864]|eukprot:XP_004343828.1 hypothetical protein CAOG_07104 [Capsaspora owczarzaki ATCC 30864]